MGNNRFTNVCYVLVVCLLGLIVLRLDPPTIYAAKKFKYQVIPVLDGTPDQNVIVQVDKGTQAGWELVAAALWRNEGYGRAEGYLIFRK